ncbi:MAG: RluA family pseudouridine synthase, partial [Deferribacterales bacterium]|nr:RluA family pseudouridine synthase [Deferribacterales bacterium]
MYKIVEEYTFIVETDCKRVDIFLSEQLSKTRSFCQKLIDLGLIKINGKIVEKSSVKVITGDSINVLIPEEEKPNLEPKEIDFEIIYEHDEYIIINKPANVVVHPAPGNFDNTLVNGLLHKFSFEVDEGDFRPGIVHRLDKDTSGLMIITKNYIAKEKFADLFKNRDIEKKYKYVLWGKPKENTYKIEN